KRTGKTMRAVNTPEPNAPPIRDEQDTLLERLKESLREAQDTPDGEITLRSALEDARPADIALAMEQLSQPEALAVFNALDTERAAEVLDELYPDLSRYLTDHSVPTRIAELLDELPMDDAAEVVSEASPAQQGKLLDALTVRAPQDAA